MEYNALTINGISTADFDFEIKVQQNDGFRMPKKKNKLIETDYITGAIKDNINAYPAIEKVYTLLCMTTDFKDLRKVKAWAKDYGTLTPYDEPDVFYEIIDSSIEHANVDAIGAYQIKITFHVQPFGFELAQYTNVYRNGHVLTNHTNAPMYPLVTVYGTSSEQTSLAIGSQTVYFKQIIEKLEIECKFLEQDVRDRNNARANSTMRGDFFEIPPGSTNTITLGPGIDRVEILERWAWL